MHLLFNKEKEEKETIPGYAWRPQMWTLAGCREELGPFVDQAGVLEGLWRGRDTSKGLLSQPGEILEQQWSRWQEVGLRDLLMHQWDVRDDPTVWF